MATQILFTNDAQLLESVAIARAARGDNAFQIDALYVRKDDGACIIQASIPNYVEHQGRMLKAYCTMALPEFPDSLKPYVSHYQGRVKPLFFADGRPVLDRNGEQVKGHLWTFDGAKPASSIQLRSGAVLCLVEDVRLSSNQPNDPTKPRNYTVDFTFEVEPGSIFGPWGSGASRPIEHVQVEKSFLAGLTASTSPTKKRSKKNDEDNGSAVPLF